MSDYRVIIIPEDPEFVPDEHARRSAWHCVATFLPGDTAMAEVTEHPVFVDPGANWSGVRCPACSAALDDSWWADRVDEAYDTHFTDLRVATPCCHNTMSL